MVKEFVDCQTVIEAGPGRGTFGQRCIKQDIEYTSIEASSIGAERIRMLGLTVHETVFPDCGIWLEFEDVELEFESRERSFRVSWVEGSWGLPRPSRLYGSFRITPVHVFCGAVLSNV